MGLDAMLPIVAIVLILTMILLSIPVSINYSFITKNGAHGYLRFIWLLGLVNIQTQFPNQFSKKTPILDKTSKKFTKQVAKKNKSYRAYYSKNGRFSALTYSKYRHHILNFIKRIFHATNPKDLYLKFYIGLDDPADTGALWAIMGPISGLLINLESIKIELAPVFIDTVFEIESHGNFRFIPLHLMALILVFLLSPTTIQAWRTTQQQLAM